MRSVFGVAALFACLIVGCSGGSNSPSKTNGSAPLPPVANAGGPYSGTVGTAVSFNGSGSSDPQGQALTFAWNFGDNTTGSGASPTHTYSTAGTYTASLTVTNTASLTGTATAKATIAAVAVPTLASVAISGATSVAVGQVEQLSLTGIYSDGSMKDLTSSAAWTSSAPTIATVSSGGTLTGVAVGQTTISATVSGVSGSQTETVANTTAVAIKLLPANPALYLGAKQQFPAVATYSDGSVQDITSTATWHASDTTKATVSSSGLVSGVAPGTVTISASSGSASASVSAIISSANSGFTLVNDTTDSRLLTYQGSDGSLLTLLGTRDSSGNPNAINGARILHSDQTWQELSFDSSGRLNTIVTSDGTESFFSWTSNTAGTVSLLTNNEAAFYTQAIDSTSAATQARLLAANDSIRPAARFRHPQSSSQPTATSQTKALVLVRSTCAGGHPEDGLSVHITKGGLFGGDPVLATDVGDGTYSADLGSGIQITNPFPQATIDAADAIDATCTEIEALTDSTIPQRGLINEAMALIEEACNQEPNPYCALLDSGVLATEAAVEGVKAACDAQTKISTTTNTINFLNSLVPKIELTFDATFNGASRQTYLQNQPSIGPFAQGPDLLFDCPQIASVSVTPASSSIPVNGVETLNAVARDSTPKIVGSSAFVWDWNSDQLPVATVIGYSSTSTNGIVVPGGLTLLPVGSVTGKAPGTATISATETTQHVPGSAQVSVVLNTSTYTFTTIAYPGAVYTSPNSINRMGQIVGYYTDSNGNEHGFLYSGGSFTTIDDPVATQGTTAEGISDNGQIAGGYNDSAGAHGFLYNAGSFTTIDYPDPNHVYSASTSLVGINDNGQITGSYEEIKNNVVMGYLAFLYSGGNFTPINDPMSNDSTVLGGINDNGQIVGAYFVKSSNSGQALMEHGFLYSDGNFTTIDYPGAITGTGLGGINDNGQIIGDYTDSNNNDHSFLYNNGNFTAIDYPGAIITSAIAISDSGQIVGEYTDTNNHQHGFLATPTQ